MYYQVQPNSGVSCLDFRADSFLSFFSPRRRQIPIFHLLFLFESRRIDYVRIARSVADRGSEIRPE